MLALRATIYIIAGIVIMFGRTAKPPIPTLSLALQGGGAHGAFTWGVLDALLENGAFRFDGVSGTSAGAMNAVALAHGLALGGPDGAREALRTFWLRVGEGMPTEFLDALSTARDSAAPAGTQMMLLLTRWLSPSQLNPLGYNPLRKIVESLFDFERIRAECPVQLFIAATEANSGRLRLFRNRELSADAVLASACLPSMQQAVVIDGEAYWDGGYGANPAVFPLIKFCHSDDILLVLLAPLEYANTPHTAEEIQQRTLELGFNSAFLREMRLIAAMREMAQEGGPLHGRLERRLLASRFHLINEEALLGALDSSSRVRINTTFLQWLHDAGYARTQDWLRQHRVDVGRRGSIDIKKMFY
ncbi:patatin-like phospholipase family protein [Uliginosibacterium gangwonense]|uniref:patatin-like phospholipase family protein n=1 Tax=Uliginosibacterium gangwonense TaxID=392736 RepID=UPI00316ABFA1